MAATQDLRKEDGTPGSLSTTGRDNEIATSGLHRVGGEKRIGAPLLAASGEAVVAVTLTLGMALDDRLDLYEVKAQFERFTEWLDLGAIVTDLGFLRRARRALLPLPLIDRPAPIDTSASVSRPSARARYLRCEVSAWRWWPRGVAARPWPSPGSRAPSRRRTSARRDHRLLGRGDLGLDVGGGDELRTRWRSSRSRGGRRTISTSSG